MFWKKTSKQKQRQATEALIQYLQESNLSFQNADQQEGFDLAVESLKYYRDSI